LAEYFSRHFGGSPLLPQARAVVQAAIAQAALPPPAFGADYDPRARSGPAPAGLEAGGQLPSGPVTLAVLLPLSDQKGAGQFARQAVRGLDLAMKEQAGGRVNLVFLDTGGVPDQAARLLAQAAADPRVLAAVGPLLREEAIAAAEAAGRADLPLIVLSQAPDLPLAGPNVFRLFLTPRHQAETLARYAVRTMNHQALGIVYPDDNYGRTVLAAFQAEAARLGARVTVIDSYSPINPDLEAVAGRITGGRGVRKASTDYQAKMDCTVLFLPDSPGPVAHFLPLLAFHYVTRMPILGSSLWLDAPDFLPASARYLQGAVIPAPLSDLSQRPESLRFFENFQQAYGHAPNQFAAYGYDAGLALIRALGQGADSRQALRQALARGATAGVTGHFTFDQHGEYQTEPVLLTIQERQFVLLRESGAPGAQPLDP
jgi:branched-chain amino acid transport system substrate-binding protein